MMAAKYGQYCHKEMCAVGHFDSWEDVNAITYAAVQRSKRYAPTNRHRAYQLTPMFYNGNLSCNVSAWRGRLLVCVSRNIKDTIVSSVIAY